MTCDFIKICDLSWEDLEQTSHGDCRYCNRCNQNVLMSYNKADMQLYTHLRHCIAIEKNHELDHRIGVMGQSLDDMDWMTPFDYHVYLSLVAVQTAEHQTFLNLILGSCLEQPTIDGILAGRRMYLFDLDKAPALVFAELMQQRGFHVELINTNSGQ